MQEKECVYVQEEGVQLWVMLTSVHTWKQENVRSLLSVSAFIPLRQGVSLTLELCWSFSVSASPQPRSTPMLGLQAHPLNYLSTVFIYEYFLWHNFHSVGQDGRLILLLPPGLFPFSSCSLNDSFPCVHPFPYLPNQRFLQVTIWAPAVCSALS